MTKTQTALINEANKSECKLVTVYFNELRRMKSAKALVDQGIFRVEHQYYDTHRVVRRGVATTKTYHYIQFVLVA